MTSEKGKRLTILALISGLAVIATALIMVLWFFSGVKQPEAETPEVPVQSSDVTSDTSPASDTQATTQEEISQGVQTEPDTSEETTMPVPDQTTEPAQTTVQPPSTTTQTQPAQTTQNVQTKPNGSASLNVACATASSWQDGSSTCTQIDVTVKNNGSSSASSWVVELTVPSGAEVSQGWNGTYTVNGSTLKIVPADHNSEVAPNASVTCGFILKTPTAFTPTDVRINGTAGSVNTNQNGNSQNNNNNNNNQGGNDVVGNVDTEALLERCEDAVQGDDWLYTDGSKIFDKDGKEVWLTGVNWFGYNTGTNIFDGVWNCNLENSLTSIADHGFNLLRIPFSAELINKWAAGSYPTANFNGALNSKLSGMNSLEIFDYVVTLCEANGLKIMIDIHSAETNAMGHTVNLWYTQNVSTAQYYAALEWITKRYKNNDTIIAIDLKNEPHGKEYEGSAAAIWNNSTSPNNWKYVAETAAKKVLAINPNLLIMVEGTEIYPKNPKTNNFTSSNAGDYYYNWWGGNLRGVEDYPLNLGRYQNKLVYSPHHYCPTVYEQPWFKGGYTYQSLMNDCWHDNWFYIYEDNIAPLLIGEWGGFMKEPNLTWMTYMRQLIKTYHLHHTFWCFNANSGDTGGLVLDDFTTWDTQKYNFVKEALWQEGGKFVGLDHAIPLGKNGITLSKAKGL